MGEVKEDLKIKIKFDTDNGPVELDCKIKEFYKDRVSLILPRGFMDYVAFLEEGVNLFVKMFSPNGTRSFDSIVINSPLETEFVIEYFEDEFIDQRNYPRVNYKTKLILNHEDKETEALTIDIGGGGLRIFTELNLKCEEEVYGYLFLNDDTDKIAFSGRIEDNPYLPTGHYSMAFTNISDQDRNKIIRATFKIETTRYKKD